MCSDGKSQFMGTHDLNICEYFVFFTAIQHHIISSSCFHSRPQHGHHSKALHKYFCTFPLDCGLIIMILTGILTLSLRAPRGGSSATAWVMCVMPVRSACTWQSAFVPRGSSSTESVSAVTPAVPRCARVDTPSTRSRVS